MKKSGFTSPQKRTAFSKVKSAYLQTNTPNPNALEMYQWTDPVFNGLVILDSMWAVSDRAGYPASTGAPGPAGR